MGSDESHFNVSLIVRDKVISKTVHKPQPSWRERRAETESSRGPSAYQPNALPLGQTDSLASLWNAVSLWTEKTLLLARLTDRLFCMHILYICVRTCEYERGREVGGMWEMDSFSSSVFKCYSFTDKTKYWRQISVLTWIRNRLCFLFVCYYFNVIYCLEADDDDKNHGPVKCPLHPPSVHANKFESRASQTKWS